MCFFYSITSLIYFHYAGVGSTPVGLWAVACKQTNDFYGALSKSSNIPYKFNPLVFGS